MPILGGMKLKGKCYDYLGHFRQGKHLKRGHNDSGKMEMTDDDRERLRGIQKDEAEYSFEALDHAERRVREAPESLSGAEWRALGMDAAPTSVRSKSSPKK